MSKQAYIAGFRDRCAELGVPEEMVKRAWYGANFFGGVESEADQKARNDKERADAAEIKRRGAEINTLRSQGDSNGADVAQSRLDNFVNDSNVADRDRVDKALYNAGATDADPSLAEDPDRMAAAEQGKTWQRKAYNIAGYVPFVGSVTSGAEAMQSAGRGDWAGAAGNTAMAVVNGLGSVAALKGGVAAAKGLRAGQSVGATTRNLMSNAIPKGWKGRTMMAGMAGLTGYGVANELGAFNGGQPASGGQQVAQGGQDGGMGGQDGGMGGQDGGEGQERYPQAAGADEPGAASPASGQGSGAASRNVAGVSRRMGLSGASSSQAMSGGSSGTKFKWS